MPMLTGQGGDPSLPRLTEQSRIRWIIAAGMACQRASSKKLVNAARLRRHPSGRSCVTLLPYLVGRRPVSPMTVALGRRQTPVTQGLLQPSGSHDSSSGMGNRPRGLLPPAGSTRSARWPSRSVPAQSTHSSPMETVDPLLGLPLVELCLRLPAYRLSQDGISRGLARRPLPTPFRSLSCGARPRVLPRATSPSTLMPTRP